MALIPYLDSDGKLVDGGYFHLLPFCKKKCSSEKCREYYQRLNSAESGAYSCPYGLSSYVYTVGSKNIIFTGLKIKGVYDKKKAKATETTEVIYNPVIDENICSTLAREVSRSMMEKHNMEATLEAMRDLLHEARSLNGQIKNNIDMLWENNIDEEDIDHETMITTLKNVHVSSFMISNRFSYFDSVVNPMLFTGSPYSAVVFKKFDKMRKLLKNYLRKNVWISIESPVQSNYRYNIYPTFETLLFILLENAIKYSPNDKAVTVQFKENGTKLDVTIQSIGPYCEENEIVHLCDKGFRGENAKEVQKHGQGFGLNFARKICEAHNIKLEFKSIYLNKEFGVKYGQFSAILHFDNSITN